MVNAREQPDARLTVLLTEDREHAIEHWTQQLPRLLEPQGVSALVARTCREAVELADERQIHAAVVDLLTPRDEHHADAGPGGLWLLEMFRRRPAGPPVVVVSNRGYSPREAQRFLNDALRLGAFSVIERPVQIDALLNVIRRVLDRRYAGNWPGTAEPRDPPLDRKRQADSRFHRYRRVTRPTQ